MKNDCIMPLGNLINKLLRGEADEWCETDFGFYLESLTHGDKKELEQILKTVDAAIVNWKSLFLISRYEDKIKEWEEGKCSVDAVDELYFEEEFWRKEGKELLTAEALYTAIANRGFMNDYHREAIEGALENKNVRFLKKDWEDMVLTQIRSLRETICCMLGSVPTAAKNEQQKTNRPLKRIEDYPEMFGVDLCCELTGYKKHTIYKLTCANEVPCCRSGSNGRKLKFKRDEIVEWLTARKQETNEEYVEEMNAKLAARTAHFYNNPNKFKK